MHTKPLPRGAQAFSNQVSTSTIQRYSRNIRNTCGHPKSISSHGHHKCSWYSNSGGGGCQEYVPRGTRVAPCCRWDTRQRGAAPRRGRDEQPSWTREQPVLLAEVVAPTPLSMRAAISFSREAQIVRLGVKMVFPSSSS